MNEAIVPLAQLGDLFPSGIAGVVIFYAPLIIGVLWLASHLVRRRKMSLGELMAITLLWVLLLAFYVSIFLADYRSTDRMNRQQEWREVQPEIPD